MKRKYITITALLLAICALSCKKASIPNIVTPVTGVESQVKFFNFGINSPNVNFYANADKISAVLSATGVESSLGVAYSSVFPATNYSVIGAGAYKFTGVTPATATTNPNVTVASVSGNLESGKFYSLYTCGFYDTNAKTTDSFIVNDVLPPVDGNAYIRFVNTVPNATEGISLYVGNTLVTPIVASSVATSIAYKSASNFIAVTPGVYELYARYASAPSTNLFVRNGTSVVTLNPGRAYTVSSRGDITVSSTGTATNRPFLDFSSTR